MKILTILTAAVVVLAAPICAADAPVNPYAGSWTIRSSAIAPWADPKNMPQPDRPERLIGKQVSFLPARIQGPSPLGCAKPVYKIDVREADGIFEGMLAEPRPGRPVPDARAAARALGFADPQKIPTLDAACTEVEFHELAPGTLVFGLNDRVFTMTRKK